MATVVGAVGLRGVGIAGLLAGEGPGASPHVSSTHPAPRLTRTIRARLDQPALVRRCSKARNKTTTERAVGWGGVGGRPPDPRASVAVALGGGQAGDSGEAWAVASDTPAPAVRRQIRH